MPFRRPRVDKDPTGDFPIGSKVYWYELGPNYGIVSGYSENHIYVRLVQTEDKLKDRMVFERTKQVECEPYIQYDIYGGEHLEDECGLSYKKCIDTVYKIPLWDQFHILKNGQYLEYSFKVSKRGKVTISLYEEPLTDVKDSETLSEDDEGYEPPVYIRYNDNPLNV